MIFSRTENTPDHSNVIFSGTILKESNEHKHLGIVLHKQHSWESHISYINEQVSSRINSLRRLQPILPRNCLEVIYKTMIRPIREHGDVLFPDPTKTQSKQLELLQRQVVLIYWGIFTHTAHTPSE